MCLIFSLRRLVHFSGRVLKLIRLILITFLAFNKKILSRDLYFSSSSLIDLIKSVADLSIASKTRKDSKKQIFNVKSISSAYDNSICLLLEIHV